MTAFHMMRKRQPLGVNGEADANQRERDRLFVRALALAFMRGDHLKAGEPRPKPPLILEG